HRSVVVEDVESAEVVDGRRHHAVDVFSSGDVGDDGDGLTAHTGDHSHRLGRAGGVDVDDADARTVAREEHRGGAALSRPRPGDQGDTAVEQPVLLQTEAGSYPVAGSPGTAGVGCVTMVPGPVAGAPDNRPVRSRSRWPRRFPQAPRCSTSTACPGWARAPPS